MASLRDRIQQLRVKKSPQTKAPKPDLPKPSVVGAEALTKPTYVVQRQHISIEWQRYQKLKGTVQSRLYDILDPTVLNELKQGEVDSHIRRVAGQLLDEMNVNLSGREREQFLKDIVDEMTGFGPLEPLLGDPSISDILVNGCKGGVYIERNGKL